MQPATNSQPITETGTRGFLLWLKQEQPGIYAKIAPELPAKAPDLFTEFEAAGGLKSLQPGMGALGQSSSFSLSPIGVQLPAMSMPTIDVASAANASAPSSSSSSWLSSLINSVASGYMTYTQAQNNQSIVNAQLTRAQEGLPPLNISPTAYGVPQITAGLSSGVLLAGGALLVGGLIWFASRRRRRA